MSLSFDDKILGEKVHNYCDSSDSAHEEDTETEEDSDHQHEVIAPPSDAPKYEIRHNGPQTGPKGVKADYEIYKLMEYHRKKAEQEKFLKSINEHALTSLTYREEKALLESKNSDDEDEFLSEFRKRRIKEMLDTSKLPRFDRVISLNTENFVDEIDKTHPAISVVVHLYEKSPVCDKINLIFDHLCQQFVHTKFCRMKATSASMSYEFTTKGVPTVLVYKNKEMVGNILRPDKDLESNFNSQDFENLLVEYGYLPDKSSVSLSSKFNQQCAVSSDSDSS
ncbi:hypothetical protein Ciccas_007460 [Cichlidogyrus casuarinus]|uniref:Phosducin domain-containing protein n=1 Tax=Cichlidogyrus casuarinus TaxID=1844966 RepID=A0ABD2Q5E6_9PLAT